MLPWQIPKPPRDIDVTAIRLTCWRYPLGQSEFASRLGVSLRTLQGWESRRRQPNGSARALLKIIEADPEAWRRIAQVAE